MTTTATTRTYTVDTAHSEAAFQVRHLITKVRGHFNDFTGQVHFDDHNPAASRVSLTIHAASVNTNQNDRDAHLRSADFFDVAAHPTLTFVSTSVVPLGDNRYDVSGDLTIRGTTRRITLPVTYLGQAKDPWGQAKVGFEAETTINRKDFGLNWNAALEAGGLLVGDDVRITVSLQAVASQA